SLLDFGSKYTLQKSFYLGTVRLRNALFERVIRLDLPHFQKTTSGDIVARLNNDVRAVRQVFTTMVSEAVLAPFTIVALLITMLLLNWRLTLIVMIGLPMVALPIAWFGKKLRSMGRRDEE